MSGAALGYPGVGATRSGELPDGYRHLLERCQLGTGRAVFAAAGDSVLGWSMHRAVGVGVSASDGRAAPGVRVTVRLGPISAPCQVVWAVADERRAGFAYGTLAGHPECGEEAFLVELAADGRVWFTVTAFSRPALWYTRALGPLVPVFQRAYARRCGRVLRRLVSRPRPGN
ncbi:DUF1990 domain-containing protein [Kitasatospora sp. RB6PN24]|uniref:DUF1990 family protein n=1 Tax=Kitasatospora humi TaxID=2893891 RepID=UPI001E41C996|nr:DUF1990 domain-containing protein [Kitasatospora humi]MCC9308222.1 DUF1990 domain-containing protein [Kitasatospora humi]